MSITRFKGSAFKGSGFLAAAACKELPSAHSGLDLIGGSRSESDLPFGKPSGF